MQLYGQDYSGTAIVTSGGELLITGSVVNDTGASLLGQFEDREINNQILTELKIMNTHLSLITGEKIKQEDIY